MVLGINTLVGRLSTKSERQSTASGHQNTLAPKKSLEKRKSGMEGVKDHKGREEPTGNWRDEAKEALKMNVDRLEAEIKECDNKIERTDKAIEQLGEESAYPTPKAYVPPPTAVIQKKPPINAGNVIRCVDDDEDTGNFDPDKNGDGRCWKIKSWKEQQLKKEIERLTTILDEKTKLLKKKRKELGKFMQEKGVTTMKVEKDKSNSADEKQGASSAEAAKKKSSVAGKKRSTS